MQIFLLALTGLLFILRIKGMPTSLSKKKYMSRIQKTINKTKTSNEGKTEEEIKLIKSVAILIAFIIYVLIGLYYIVLGSRFNELYFTILSVMQLMTVIISCKRSLNMKAVSDNIEDYKFYRFYFLFNIILDLVYYPLAFYLLLK